jgi:sulfur carrier protein ThiS
MIKERTMATIKFSAFSFLKQQLNDRGIACSTSPLEIVEGITLSQLLEQVGLRDEEVEAIFVNHRIMPKDTILKDGDKIALVPPGGIPGHVAAYVGRNNR